MRCRTFLSGLFLIERTLEWRANYAEQWLVVARAQWCTAHQKRQAQSEQVTQLQRFLISARAVVVYTLPVCDVNVTLCDKVFMIHLWG